LIIDLLVLVLYSHRSIKVDDLQAKLPVDNLVVGFDIPVGDSVPVEILKAIDEA